MNPAAAHRILDGKYELVRPIGKGGMGAVYEARHLTTGRSVAVKVIAVDPLFVTPAIVQRFEREARATGAVESPHIAQILDAGADPATGDPYLVMELLAGEDLYAAHLRVSRFPPDLALRVASQACLGLERAHAAGVIHRDIKPANIFLARGREGEVTVKLLDFGIAKVTHDPKLTVSGVVHGSPRYMSPEQALGGQSLDHRSDLWSLGVVLYELLTGGSPHDDSDVRGVLVQICTVPARPLRDVAPWVTPDLAALVHRALARNPADRFASAAEMGKALGAFLPDGHALSVTMFSPLATPLSESFGDAATVDSRSAPSPLAVTATGTASPPGSAGAGPVYPDYVVTGEHGRGGRGRVLRANDRRLGRTVAMKEMLEDTPADRARFLREARLTARLQHPSIVPVYELGFRSDGAPFYTMKLVTGERLDVAIQKARSLAERLALLPSLIAVTEAVAFAHERRIIHRDLKPGNVIVGAFGETVVIDWGLAKDLSDSSIEVHSEPDVESRELRVKEAGETPIAIDATVLAFGSESDAATRVGQVAGTLLYMPGEQFRGERVDERADVFALGATLYQLVAGEPPNVNRLFRDAADPSDGVQPLEAREPGVPGELATIVHKAMALRAEDRYATAGELAADLRRFQTGQLVGAHRYSLGLLLRRWVVRHKAAVLTSLAFATTLAVLGSLAITRIIRERDRAEAARARTDVEHGVAVEARRAAEERATRLTLLQAESSLERDPTAAVAWLKTYPESGADWGRLMSIAAEAERLGVAREVFGFEGNTVNMLAISPDGHTLAGASMEGKYVRVWDLESGHAIATYPQGGTNGVTFASDSSRVAAAGADGTIVVIDSRTGASHTIRDQVGSVRAVASAPESPTFASCGEDGAIRLRSWSDPEPRVIGRHDAACGSLAWAPDGKRIASIGADAKMRVSSLSGAKGLVFPLAGGGGAEPVAWSSDGRHVAAVDDSVVHVWDVEAGTSLALAGHKGWIGDIAFMPDGARIVSAGQDGTVRIWDVAGRLPPRVLTGHTRAVASLSVSRDGVHVASCGGDREARLFDVETGTAKVLHGRTPMGSCVLSRDGAFLATGTTGTVRFWDLREPPETVARGHTDVVEALTWFPDGARFWTGSADLSVRIWDAKTGAPLAILAGSRAPVDLGAKLDPAGARIVTGGGDSKLDVWDISTSKLLRVIDNGAEINSLQTLGDGRTVVTGGADGRVRIWDATTGDSTALDHEKGHEKEITHLDLSPDRTLVSTASDDGTVRLRDLATGEVQAVLKMSAAVLRTRFSPNGAMVAGSDLDGQVRVWDPRSGKLLRDLSGYGANLLRLQFTPDSRGLVFAGASGTIDVCDLETGNVRALEGHRGLVRGIDISPDGSLIASIGVDGTARLWDFASGRVRALRRADDVMRRVAFSPDGRSLAVATDTVVRVYPIDPASLIPLDAEGFRGWLSRLTSAEIDPRGEPFSPVR